MDHHWRKALFNPAGWEAQDASQGVPLSIVHLQTNRMMISNVPAQLPVTKKTFVFFRGCKHRTTEDGRSGHDDGQHVQHDERHSQFRDHHDQRGTARTCTARGCPSRGLATPMVGMQFLVASKLGMFQPAMLDLPSGFIKHGWLENGP